MRIHSDTLTFADLHDAATIARVQFDRWDYKGSRSRDHAFDVTLTGESNRRPNNGTSHQTKGSEDFAATWDQWGVFLGVLFDRDPDMLTPYYADRADFQFKTNARFTKIGGGWDNYWPADAHGDHRFQYSGTPGAQKCTRCTAVRRWM